MNSSERTARSLGILSNSRGFTLVELAVVIIIIGVLAAFAVPRFRSAVERSKAGEAFNYLSSIRASQERYHARNAEYGGTANMDIKMSTPKYFTVGTVLAGSTASLEDSWKLKLTRTGAAAGYGAYTVEFNHTGYDASASTIVDDVSPMK